MSSSTHNKVSTLEDMQALGIAVANGHAQKAEGVLPPSLNGSIKTLSERLAEGMSNEFYRMKDCANCEFTKEFFDTHEKFTKYVPGYKEEFVKIHEIR